jgi:hypothetical protein
MNKLAQGKLEYEKANFFNRAGRYGRRFCGGTRFS